MQRYLSVLTHTTNDNFWRVLILISDLYSPPQAQFAAVSNLTKRHFVQLYHFICKRL